MAALKSVDVLWKKVAAKVLQEDYRGQQGIPFDQIFAQIEQVARARGELAPIRSEIETTAVQALRAGFVTVIPSGSTSSAPRYVATDDYYDMALFPAAMEGFDCMLATAREDARFDNLFEALDATE